MANRGSAGDWEVFSFQQREGGAYTIKARVNGKLVAPRNNGEFELSASVTDGASAPAETHFYVLTHLYLMH